MNALLTYRRLTEADIPTFVTMRITQLKEEGAQSDLDLEPALTAYYQKHLADGTFVSWLAVDGEKIAGAKNSIDAITCGFHDDTAPSLVSGIS